MSRADMLRIVNTAILVCEDVSRPAMAEDLESVRDWIAGKANDPEWVGTVIKCPAMGVEGAATFTSVDLKYILPAGTKLYDCPPAVSVAELIAADKEYDAASETLHSMAGDKSSSGVAFVDAMKRVEIAAARRASALAALEGNGHG